MARASVKLGFVVLSFLIPGLSFSCQAPPPETGPHATAEQEIEQVRAALRSLLSAMNRGDTEAMSPLISPEFRSMPPGAPLAEGSGPFLESMKAAFAAVQVQTSFTSDEIQIFGEWAFVRGRFTRSILPRAGGPPSVETGKSIQLFRKEGEAWRLYTNIWNLSQ